MELELKHLAPYLPYRLKVMYTHGNKFGEVKGLSDISEYDDIKIRMDYQDGEHIWMFKPILRPMSEFVKPHGWGIGVDMGCYSITQFQYMAKHHFDVFGLIEQGLAIDINTVD